MEEGGEDCRVVSVAGEKEGGGGGFGDLLSKIVLVFTNMFSRDFSNTNSSLLSLLSSLVESLSRDAERSTMSSMYR